MATWAGGAICNPQQKGRISVIDSSFEVLSPYLRDKNYFGGEIIYSSGELTLIRTRISSMDKTSQENSLIFHTSLSENVRIKDINVTCPPGKDIIVTSPVTVPVEDIFGIAKDPIIALTVKCFACPSQQYSVLRGKVGPNLKNQSHIHCHNCPFGGNCINGQIKASDNFWGHRRKSYDNEIHFVTCPYGYCCVGKQCKTYNSCAHGRHGTLCGQCQQGLTENIFTPVCVKPEGCHTPWFWFVIGVTGIGYVLFFMCQKEAANLAVAILVPKSILASVKRTAFGGIKTAFQKIFKRNIYIDPLTDDISCESIEFEETQFELQDPVQVMSTDNTSCIKESDNFFPGLLKIVFFFYQTNVLFKVYTTGKSHRFAHFLQEIIATLLNLRTDGLFSQSISWCPFPGLHPVSKLVFKASFVLYMFTVILVLLCICKIFRLAKHKYNAKAFHSRVNCCVLRILLISYSTITVSCFTLLNCITLGKIGEVLYIDGTIKCYQWWQYIVFAIICVWIASYPITIYTSSWLLHRNKLGKKSFLVSLLLPLPTVLYWTFIRIFYQKSSIDRVMADAILEEDTKEMLNVLEGPFRKYHETSTNKTCNLAWEVILIGRRLILILVKTFINDVVLRLYLMLVLMILFTFHHIYVQPYSTKILNNVETISLFMLIIICIINTVPAYIYMNPLSVSPHIQNLSKIFREIETVLMLIVPFIVGCCACILVLIRALQFIYWMCNVFVRLIRFCCKKKQS